MHTEQVEALRDAAADGVALDGLEAEYGDGVLTSDASEGSSRDGGERDGAYRFAVRGETRTGLTESEFVHAAEDAADYVTNWYFWEYVAPSHDARRAFLRWLEGADAREVPTRYDELADGVSRTWGELELSVALGEDGRRTYDVRHEDDAGVPVADLHAYEDPREARELVKYDRKERYRPLKTAPSLRDGWVFPDLGAAALVETVGFVYPATIANWHREREAELDVSHWHETAERQTGIYDIVDELDPEAVDRIAATCCVDSQCLKRREWEFDEDRELDADGGDGRFPCREPCSLVVAAARKWTTLEREETRTYEFDLTPSEKEQIEEIIDAVADDRTDDIREADVYEGANRYRTRYLREKLFDEDGRLCGVPTEE